jgi:hypothetical protein
MPVDIGSIKRNDQIAGAAAVLAFIFALIPGVRSYDVKDQFKDEAEAVGKATESANLWHGLGVLAAILMIVAIAGLAAAIVKLPQVEGYPVRWISTGLWGLVSLLVLIFIFTYEGTVEDGGISVDAGQVYDIGPGIVGFILLLLCIGTTAFAAMGAQESGEKLPWQGQQPAGPEATPPPAA